MAFSPLDHLSFLQLDNGLRIYLKPSRGPALVSVQAWVRVGSIDETPAEAGLSHVLEHMVFKGTANHKAADISRWIESLGGSLNAETSKEYTHYYIDVPSPGARQAVSLMGELLYRATFDPDEWVRECPVILEEIKRRNDDPEAMLWDVFNDAVFDDIRLRRAVIGFPKTVRDVTPDGLRTFYRKHYTGRRSIVVVAGHFDPRDMRSWLKKAFDRMPAGGAARQPLPSQGTPTAKSRSLKRPVRQSYVAIGFPTPPAVHSDQERLDLLAAVSGEGRSSRLVESLREQKKLVWSVSAANITHEGPGVFGVFIDCDQKKREKGVEAAQKELMRFRRNPPTRDEVQRSKHLLQTAWLQSYETFHSQASTVGSFALDHHLDRLERYLPRLMAVTTKELKAVVDQYLQAAHFSTAVVEA
jgi:zinc protease